MCPLQVLSRFPTTAPLLHFLCNTSTRGRCSASELAVLPTSPTEGGGAALPVSEVRIDVPRGNAMHVHPIARSVLSKVHNSGLRPRPRIPASPVANAAITSHPNSRFRDTESHSLPPTTRAVSFKIPTYLGPDLDIQYHPPDNPQSGRRHSCKLRVKLEVQAPGRGSWPAGRWLSRCARSGVVALCKLPSRARSFIFSLTA